MANEALVAGAGWRGAVFVLGAALLAEACLDQVDVGDFDAVFYPGGHGPLWDLAEDADSIRLIEQAFSAGKPVAAVCHGPAVFRHPRGALGEPLVKDKRVTGFSNEEEAAVGLTDVVPFSLEDALKLFRRRVSDVPARMRA